MSTPEFHLRRGGLLGGLARVGVSPQDVDVVVNTHIHVDHGGGNTVDAGGEWVPAFPNAEYLIPAADDAHFGPGKSDGNGLQPDDRLICADSIAPIHLESAPGHTPARPCCGWPPETSGRSSSEMCCTAPCRFSIPTAAVPPAWPLNKPPVRVSGSSTRAVDERKLLVPAHFGGAGAVEIRRDNGGFILGEWA
ncbi:MBL fold metallo-hydrolase [Lentzea sp. NPDC004782]|uniref:MBL fold metallo-hydrolase n=1 Tax=Lentzea sp. NPDC004782 TaxID=3154458 RepID=UPI0033A902D8